MGDLKYKFLNGANLSLAKETLVNQKPEWFVPNTHSICSQHLLWRLNFFTKNNRWASMYLLLWMRIKWSLRAIWDNSASSQGKIPKCITSRTSTPFPADSSREHENGTCIALPKAATSPRSPTGFNLQKRKKKSANSVCWWVPPHVSTFHSHRRAGWLDKIVRIALYQGKIFL